MKHKKLSITSLMKTYEVSFLNTLNELSTSLTNISQAIIIIDHNLVTLYPDFIKQLQHHSPVFLIEANEENKTLSGMETILHFLQQHGATKSTTLIGIGGGIIQDIVSFVAHIYYRGIPFVFVPTTLLAMCDSCIGGKTGLNFQGFKNQLGTFHAPESILLWHGFLETLPLEAIYSGYGEIAKLMILDHKTSYETLKYSLEHRGFLNHLTTLQFIFQALSIKKPYVEEDEFDQGVRRILNFGHTFGHALELATHYAIPHGIAVARGIDIANFISYQKGFLSETHYHEIHNFINTYFYCGIHTTIAVEQLIHNVLRDKKITNGQLHMILLADFGHAVIEKIAIDKNIHELLNQYIIHQTNFYQLSKVAS